MELIESFVKENPCYKAGKKIIVRGLVLHSVGCAQPSAAEFVKKFNSSTAKVCVHAFIDANDGKIYQTLPWEYKAWHCGGSGNSSHIGVEMCEPGCIKYGGGASFTCSDEVKAKECVMRTLHSAVELFAFLCKKYKLDPLEAGVVVSHKEGHDRGIASGHSDPDHLFRQLHMDYTMDDFRKAVAEAMETIVFEEPGNKTEEANKGEANGNETTKSETAGSGTSENETNTKSDTKTDIKEGDIVTLTTDATYYSGKEMPGWVKSDQWIVKSVAGDRAVLGKNISGSNEINSPVHVKYLQGTGVAVKVEEQQRKIDDDTHQEKAKTPDAGGMSVSDRGVELVAKYEGCRLEAYKCPAGVWTIGYGHTEGVQPGQTISKDEAKELLKEDLKKYGNYVNKCVNNGKIAFPLTQNQFDALTSFCYNCGEGTLGKLVTGRDAATVADKILLYNKGGGRELAGLTKRREEERALFLT